MFKARDLVAFLVLEALILQPVVLSRADQPYSGMVYTNGVGSIYASNEVIGGCDWHGTNPSTFPTGRAVGSVLSCEAAHGTSFGWTDLYQAPVLCFPNGVLHFAPQIWQATNRVWSVPTDILMNTYTDYWVLTWDTSCVFPNEPRNILTIFPLIIEVVKSLSNQGVFLYTGVKLVVIEV